MLKFIKSSIYMGAKFAILIYKSDEIKHRAGTFVMIGGSLRQLIQAGSSHPASKSISPVYGMCVKD